MALYDQVGRSYDDDWLYDAKEGILTLTGVGTFSAQVPNSTLLTSIELDGDGNISFQLDVKYAVSLTYSGEGAIVFDAIRVMPIDLTLFGESDLDISSDLFLGYFIDWSDSAYPSFTPTRIKDTRRTILINYALRPRS